MELKNIKESFEDLLESLASGGIIQPEEKSRLASEFGTKVNESVMNEEEDMETKFRDAIEQAAKKLCEDLKQKTDMMAGAGDEAGGEAKSEEGGAVEEQDTDAEKTKTTIADAFKKFLSCLDDANVKAFNDLTASLTEEQKALGKAFLSGEFCEENGELPAGDTDGKETGEEGEEEEEDDEKGEALKEACAIIVSMKTLFEDAGMGEIPNNMMLEASNKIAALTARQYKAQEKFLKNSIRQMAKQNKVHKLSGGTPRASKRTRNLDEVLSMMRKKLYLSEAANKQIKEDLLSLRNRYNVGRHNLKTITEAAEQSEMKLRELRTITEAAKRSEIKIHDLTAEIETLKNVNKKLEEANLAITSDNRRLNEANEKLSTEAKTAGRKALISEAKAYLTESVKDMPAGLRQHLLRQFSGCSLGEVKAGLNEAVEAYQEERRKERANLRKDSNPSISRTVNEAIENKVGEEDEDSLVKGFTRISESFVKK